VPTTPFVPAVAGGRALFAAHPWWFAGGLMAVGLGALPRPTAALAWRPSVDLGARFDDLHTPVAAPRDTLAGTIAPRLELRGGSQRLRASVSAQRQYWSPLPRPAGSGTLRPATDRVAFHGTSDWAGGEKLFLDGRYLRPGDAFQLDLPESSDGAVARWGGAGGGNLGWADGACRIEGWSYATGAPRNAIGIASRASVMPWRGPRDAWVLGFRHLVLQLDQAYQIRSYLVSTGYRRFLSPVTWAQVEVGAAKVLFGDTTSARGPALVFELGGPTNPLGAVTTSVTFCEELPTAVSAGIGRPLPSGSISVRWESLIDPQGGAFRHPHLSRRASLEVQDTLSRATVLELSVSRAQSRPYRLMGPEPDVVRASAWLVRRMRPWLTGRCGYSYLSQASRGPGSTPAYRRMRLDVAMTVQR